MAVEVVFETHWVTTDNEAGVATGWLGGRLSERGRALATELGRRRRYDGVAAVFVSDLGRAVETVELGFGGSDVPIYLDARLRECDYGAWNGMPVSRLERERAQRISRPFPDGESYLQVVARVASFLEELARDWAGTRVLVVGHSATRWALDYLLAGAASTTWWRHRSMARRLVLRAAARVASCPAWSSPQMIRNSSTVERSWRSSSLKNCRATTRFRPRRPSRALLPSARRRAA